MRVFISLASAYTHEFSNVFYVLLLWTCAKHVGCNCAIWLIWNKRPNRQAAGGTWGAASTAPLSLAPWDMDSSWSVTIDAPRYVSGQGLRPWRKTWQVLRDLESSMKHWCMNCTWIYFDPHFETSQRPLSSNRLMLTHALHCNKDASSFKLHKHAQTKIKTY